MIIPCDYCKRDFETGLGTHPRGQTNFCSGECFEGYMDRERTDAEIRDHIIDANEES